MSSPRPAVPPGHRLAVAVTAVTLVAAATGCGQPDQPPDALAFEPGYATTTPDRAPTPERETAVDRPDRSERPATGEALPPVALGQPDRPFAPLPRAERATAIVTDAGVVLPVVAERGRGAATNRIVVTPCANVRTVAGGRALGRAHVVLDPGHGGREYGAVGPEGTIEKDLNLAVALAVERRLTEAGAVVVLTRSTDVTMTTGVRATLGRTVGPALFVSIHHNGGAPASDGGPGTIVFTRSGSDEARRFGGLAYDRVVTALRDVGHRQRQAFDDYAATFTAHEDAIDAYDRALAARDQALAANGQIDPTATTAPPADRPEIDGTETPRQRQPITTTTRPVPDDGATVAVPEPPTPPPTPELERVRQLRWAGSGNAGVRSWVSDPDTEGGGRDILSVLRRSGRVPSALVELTYVTNPAEEALLNDDAFIELEAAAVADAIVDFFSGTAAGPGSGFVADQVGDWDIGGGGRPDDCVEPPSLADLE